MTHEQQTSVLTNMEATLSAPPKSNPWTWLPGLAVLAVGLGLYWYSDVIFNYAKADAECIKFAEEAQISPALDPDPSDKKIFVAKKWVKNGYVVVELGQKVASKRGYYQSRLCVIGGDQIQIPSMFEQWQYR